MNGTDKSLESWIWDAAKYKEFILPLIFTKRLCDVFEDGLNRPEEMAKNDFHISPSRYIHTGEGEVYRPIVEILDELETPKAEAKTTDAALKAILARIGR